MDSAWEKVPPSRTAALKTSVQHDAGAEQVSHNTLLSKWAGPYIYTWSRTHAPAFTGPWSNGRQRLVRSSWIVSVSWEQGGRRRLCLGGSVACCIRVLKMVKGLPWRLRNDLQLGKREDVTQYKTKWTAKSWESTKWNAFNDTTLIWKGFCWILNKRSWGRWWPWMFRMQYDIQYLA